MRVVLASNNQNKIREMKAILSPLGWEVLSQREAGCHVDPEENGRTFEENSRIKAQAVMEATGLPAIADDSGVAVDALDGAPGVHSARYGGESCPDDKSRNRLLIENMDTVPDGQRTARFVSMLTSKQRAELRAQANGLEVTLMIGKEGVTDAVAQTAHGQLENRELIKGRVLETAGLTAREASDAVCEATGADGVSCVGGTFVIYRKSKKLEQERAAAKAKERAAKKVNPVREGKQRRKAQAQEARARKDEFFRQQREKARKNKI